MSTNVNSLIGTVPKLNGQNYHDWKFAISMVLRRADAWEIVAGKKERPDGRGNAATTAATEWDTKADEALTIIGLTIGVDQYQYIRDATNGIEAWEALAKIYEKNSRANRIALKRQFYSYQHDPTLPIQEYISGITGLAARLKAIGVTLKDIDINDVLLF